LTCATSHWWAVTANSPIYWLTRVLLLFVLAAASPSVSLCAGWASSAAERMACCERDASGCASVSADSCCADGETRQNIEALAAVVTLQQPLATTVPIVAAPRPALRAVDPRSLAKVPATHLLHSVFRI
jgi:hypothetical protein